jgi:lipopolysaccharide heptosyltransferase II
MNLLLWVLLPTRLAIWWLRIARRHRQPSSERKSFIVFRLDALGDLVLTTPLFRELKRSYPHAHITAVVQGAYKSILATNPSVDEVLTIRSRRNRWLPKGTLHLLAVLSFYRRKLRSRRFDVGISPRWDTDEHLATLLCLLTNAGLRVGYSEKVSTGKQQFNRLFDQAFDVCLEPGPLGHEVLRNLEIIPVLGGRVHNTALDVHLAQRDREYAEQVLRGTGKDSVLIALGIGAQSSGRRWPVERYAAMINELSTQWPVQVVITCAPSEHELAKYLAHRLWVRSIVSDSPEIRKTCALLARCDLFVGNDTGAAHLAAAMNCPTIVISRHPTNGDPEHPNSPARFAPWYAASRVLQPERGLDDCVTRCRRSGPHCIEQISVADVVDAASAMLMQHPPTRDKLEASLAL